MSARSLRTLLFSVAVFAALPGCQLMPGAATSQAGPSARITAITPDPSQPLRAGQAVTMKVDIAHVVAADSATLTLIVLAGDSAALAQDAKVLARGRGSSTLTATFTVPRTPIVRVFTSLVVEGQGSTSAVDGRAYEVLSP